MKEGSRRSATGIAAGLSLLFFILYATRVAQSLTLTGDSAELLTAAAVWGVPHAPGYPLFTAIAHAFAQLPVGSLPFRIHLTSALFHSLAIGATALTTFSITKSRLAAVATGMALGFEHSFFLGSLYVEVFPLNDLLFATLLLAAVRFREREVGPFDLAVAAGVGCAHHMMIALAAPAVLLLAAPRLRDELRSGRIGVRVMLACVLPPLLACALIPLSASRDPAISWGDVHDLRSLLSLVSRSDYGGLFSSVHGAGHGTGWQRVAALGSLLWQGFGPAAAIFVAAGISELLSRQRPVGIALCLAALTSGPLFAWLNAVDTSSVESMAFFQRFTTMCAIPFAIAFGAGVESFARALPATYLARIAGVTVIAFLGAAAFSSVRGIDLHRDHRGVDFAHDLVLRTPDHSLILLTGDAQTNAALYVCAVERLCGERTVVSPGSLFMPWAMAQLRRRHPEIEIPWQSGPAVARTHELATAASRDRPVFAYPNLLEKDPLLRTNFTAMPDHLLFRLWPLGADRSVQREAFVASARDVLGGDLCEACETPEPTLLTANEVGLGRIYQATRDNHKAMAANFPETEALDFHFTGASMSRKSSSLSR